MTRTFKKERKGKGLLYLIVIVAMALAMVIACKNKPTQTSDFSGIDLDIETTNGASTNPKPTDTNSIVSVDADLDQYAGVYKSIYQYREGWNDSMRTFYYKMELKKDSANKWQLLWKKGDYANNDGVSYGGGYETIRTLNRDTANDNVTRGKAFGDWETHYVTFDSDANGVYLTLIPDRYSIVIRCKKE